MKKYFLALVSGLINGMFGTGGGTVALPMLNGVLNDEKKAYQSVALFILPLSIISAIIYQNNQESAGLGFVAFGALFGGIAGALLNKKIELKYLKIIFGTVILYVGVNALL